MEKSPVTCIIMATMLEAKPFVNGMSLKKKREEPFQSYEADNLILVISGVGKTNAAVAAAYCCQEFRPSSVCNLGAAGATDFSHSLGEICHIEELIEYDRPIFESGVPHRHIPHILKGFQTAKLATQDRAIIHADERKEISSHASLVDMEGASVVQTCRIFQTNCIVFKFVSDTPDHTTGRDIVKNIRLYRTPFYEFCLHSVIPILITGHSV